MGTLYINSAASCLDSLVRQCLSRPWVPQKEGSAINDHTLYMCRCNSHQWVWQQTELCWSGLSSGVETMLKKLSGSKERCMQRKQVPVLQQLQQTPCFWERNESAATSRGDKKVKIPESKCKACVQIHQGCDIMWKGGIHEEQTRLLAHLFIS